jgi:beta-glucanase (GH16 family)
LKVQVETSSGAVLAALGVVAGIGLLLRKPAPVPAVPPVAVVESPVTSPAPARAQATLTFADEFNGAALDTSKWLDSYPDGKRTHSNNEQQYYSPHGYVVRDGKLLLIARREAAGGMPYTSGMISSYGKFAEVRDFRAAGKVSQGQGPLARVLAPTRQ